MTALPKFISENRIRLTSGQFFLFMKQKRNNIIILGAGPGGIACSLSLAKAGATVTVLEKAQFPRDKICGDACSGKVVEVLRKINPDYVSDVFTQPFQLGSHGVCFIAPNGKMLRIPFATKNKKEHAPGFISRRIDFDNYLYQIAKKQDGIQIESGVEAQAFTKSEIGWTIQTNRETYFADMIIDASGAHSPFARQIAHIQQQDEHYCAGLRAYYTNVSGLDKENYIELHFIKDFLPGYFWIFPLANGLANVGVGLRSDVISKKRINLKKEMTQIIAEHPVISKRFEHAALLDSLKGWGLPLGSLKRKISGEGYLLIGDAASLIDPFTGEGIGNAMLSGWIAAQIASQALQVKNFSAAFLTQYDEAIYKRLWQELSLSRRLQQLAAYPSLFNWVVNKANKNQAFSEMISCMFEDLDLRSRFKQPSFYFKLLFY